MAKKNFDAFINAAGKKPKPTPEEVEAMARQLHQTTDIAPKEAVPTSPASSTIKQTKPTATKAAKPKVSNKATTNLKRKGRNIYGAEAPKEKVRITIDLAKDLYKRMKLAVVQNETEISAYVRNLIETDLSGK
ncbi:MAG: hypothetical protein GC192_16000 [Bacteroidetes bacterium]|nr:hypothetical protein [Bacteroidota bacterium]